MLAGTVGRQCRVRAVAIGGRLVRQMQPGVPGFIEQEPDTRQFCKPGTCSMWKQLQDSVGMQAAGELSCAFHQTADNGLPPAVISAVFKYNTALKTAHRQYRDAVAAADRAVLAVLHAEGLRADFGSSGGILPSAQHHDEVEHPPPESLLSLSLPLHDMPAAGINSSSRGGVDGGSETQSIASTAALLRAVESSQVQATEQAKQAAERHTQLIDRLDVLKETFVHLAHDQHLPAREGQRGTSTGRHQQRGRSSVQLQGAGAGRHQQRGGRGTLHQCSSNGTCHQQAGRGPHHCGGHAVQIQGRRQQQQECGARGCPQGTSIGVYQQHTSQGARPHVQRTSTGTYRQRTGRGALEQRTRAGTHPGRQLGGRGTQRSRCHVDDGTGRGTSRLRCHVSDVEKDSAEVNIRARASMQTAGTSSGVSTRAGGSRQKSAAGTCSGVAVVLRSNRTCPCGPHPGGDPCKNRGNSFCRGDGSDACRGSGCDPDSAIGTTIRGEGNGCPTS